MPAGPQGWVLWLVVDPGVALCPLGHNLLTEPEDKCARFPGSRQALQSEGSGYRGRKEEPSGETTLSEPIPSCPFQLTRFPVAPTKNYPHPSFLSSETEGGREKRAGSRRAPEPAAPLTPPLREGPGRAPRGQRGAGARGVSDQRAFLGSAAPRPGRPATWKRETMGRARARGGRPRAGWAALWWRSGNMPSSLFHPDIMDTETGVGSPHAGILLGAEPEPGSQDGEPQESLRFALGQLSLLAGERLDCGGAARADALDPAPAAEPVPGGVGFAGLQVLEPPGSPPSCSPPAEIYCPAGFHLDGGSMLGDPGAAVIGSRKRSVNMTECVPVPSSEHVAEIVGRQVRADTEQGSPDGSLTPPRSPVLQAPCGDPVAALGALEGPSEQSCGGSAISHCPLFEKAMLSAFLDDITGAAPHWPAGSPRPLLKRQEAWAPSGSVLGAGRLGAQSPGSALQEGLNVIRAHRQEPHSQGRLKSRRAAPCCKIKALRAKTNTYIKTPMRGEEPVFIVTGRREDVEMAKREILSAAEHFSLIRASRSKAGPVPGVPAEELGFEFSAANIWAPFANGASGQQQQRRNSSTLTPRLSPTQPLEPAPPEHPLARRAQSDPLSALSWLQAGAASFSGGSSSGGSSTGYSSCSASSLPGGSPTDSEGGGGAGPGGALGPSKGPAGPGSGAGAARDCCLCFESQVTAALVPCGHNLFCMDCAGQICESPEPECPVCHTPATQCIRIFS
ncbi:MEX3D protein, partial [Atractosteus spatula]|nr:MEX3D protein [Atractosteus spatula]